MRRLLVLSSVIFFSFGISGIIFFLQSQKKPTLETVSVSRVIDGDTVELSDGRRLRYIGIDTPEIVHPTKPVECFGNEAKVANQKLVESKTIRLVKDISNTDKYGRLLRYVYVDNIFVNDYLVRQGFAHASTYPPDVVFSKQFLEAEREAREDNRGLWDSCARLEQ